MKVGDKVIITYEGLEGVIKEIQTGEEEPYVVKDINGSYESYTEENLELIGLKELKDVEFGDMITDGTDFRYIFGRVNDVIFTGLGDTGEEAKNAKAYTWSLQEFLKEFGNCKFVGESDDVDVTVDGKTTTISRKSAEALNLI